MKTYKGCYIEISNWSAEIGRQIFGYKWIKETKPLYKITGRITKAYGEKEWITSIEQAKRWINEQDKEQVQS